MYVFFAVVIVVGAIAVFVASAIVERRNRTTWKTQTAAALGLSETPGPAREYEVRGHPLVPELHGTRDGFDVYVGARRYRTRPGGDHSKLHHYTYADVQLTKPLGLGLEVDPNDFGAKLIEKVAGQLDIETGNKQLDVEYRIRGNDKSRVAALVGTPAVAELLLVKRKPFAPYLFDTHVRFQANRVIVKPDELRPIVDAAVALAKAVESARR